MADIKSIMQKKESLSKIEFEHFIAEFESFREGILKHNYKLELEMEKMKDCLNELQDDLKDSGAIKRKKRF